MSISRCFFRPATLLVLALVLSGCFPALTGKKNLLPVQYVAEVDSQLFYTLLDDGETASLAAAVEQSLAYYRKLGADQALSLGGEKFPAAAMEESLNRLLAMLKQDPSPGALAAKLARFFSLYRVQVPSGILFTGYYRPVIAASAKPDETYRYPILAPPPDLVAVYLPDFCQDCPPRTLTGRVVGGRLVPYFSRAEIEAGALGERAQPIAWVKDAVALFFLQVQGSGVLLFPDGSRRPISFAESNGLPYRSIGKYLIEAGKLQLEEASASGLRQYLSQHPEEQGRVLAHNSRYVFFKLSSGPPAGSIGAILTPGRSIAADPQFFPPGVLAFIRTRRYEPAKDDFVPLSRFVLSQDAGAAIRGPGRVDIYWGEGERAELLAGRQRTRGELYLLMPRQ